MKNFKKLLAPQQDGMKYEMTIQTIVIVPLLKYMFVLEKGERSDGASGARDLGVKESGWRGLWSRLINWLMHTTNTVLTYAWWVHDQVCRTGLLPNGQKCSVFLASLILSLLLWKDGYKKEAITWFYPTMRFGGGKCRDNGIFWVKETNAS
jgi:hypothetical protein